MPENLLQSKLYPPRGTERLVFRQSLVDRLNEHRYRPLTLISAPAGYGKSTLALQWLQSGDDAFAWLSLDEYDRELDDLVIYLIGALRTVLPDVGRRTSGAINTPQLHGAERVSEMLLSELDDLAKPVFLVIDDYYTITNQEIHRFMARFLQRLPANLHVALLTRMDPPLHLSRLRGQGQMREIRGADLRFSSEESAEFLALVSPEPLPAQTVQLLAEVTEGWPFGLRMAALFLRDAADPDAATRRFAAEGNRTITDYLLGEVMENLSEERQLLLLRTAVSDRFCAPLIKELAADLLPPSSSHAFLEWLWSSNFFLITLDDRGNWYRYHHLFRQLLDRELRRIYSAEEIARLHKLAAQWFEREGEVEDAIMHWVRAGRAVEAARIVERHVNEAVNREAWRVVDRWVGLLPEEARHSAGLLATQAMVEQFRMRIGSMTALLDEAELALDASDYSPKERDYWTGIIYAVRATGLVPGNSPEDILSFAEKATRLLDPSAAYAYSHAEMWQIIALRRLGRPEEALRLVQDKLVRATGKVDARNMRLMLAHCGVHQVELNSAALRQTAVGYLDAARRADKNVSVGWALYLLGWSAYEENDLNTAARYFAEAVAGRHAIHIRTVVDSYTGLALTNRALGKTEEALGIVNELRNFLLDQELTDLLPVADSLSLNLGFENNPRRPAAGMAIHIEVQLAAEFWEQPVFTATRLKIAEGRPGDLAVAEEILTTCRKVAQSKNNKPQLLQIGILESLLHEANGRRTRALETLRQMIVLAEPGGTLRYFVDAGPALIPLLRSLATDGHIGQYVGRVLGAFGEAAKPLQLPAGSRIESPSNQPVQGLVGELTNREEDVLVLLGRRLTNKEIAAELHISPSTVKKHTINVYEKLGVDGRRQAAARASELGLI